MFRNIVKSVSSSDSKGNIRINYNNVTERKNDKEGL